ncbi:cytochrome d ubiquinol oxidase subunit II [Psychromicrobium xiongbiense]|uniref:cytochrome d ubiquinol oxidase subunit II n=1 Tax=Psychromicrobium xiongbiense TaxID=3051184 RepID=UPI0025574ADD|nr:cytochrome d ubiquinol oxidase subunit II [Psychromicrobium sp. YIM S02556]
MDFLPILWFVLIAVLWVGYLFLEGFDLGVGMLMTTFARGNRERRLLLNTIGPVWDGNEVWLITAIGATFAAFPLWYGSLLSSLYLPFFIVLLGLIFRAVAFEYRGKVDQPRWRAVADLAIAIGSFVASFGIGVVLGTTTTGLPVNGHGDRVGGAFAWFSWPAMLGGVAVVSFALIHACAFVTLKSTGEVRHRARALVVRWVIPAGLPLLAWVLLVQIRSGSWLSWLSFVVAALALCGVWLAARGNREGWAFLGLGSYLVAAIGSLFGACFPVVLPSTLDSAFDLTVTNASSSPYTLGLMSVVAAFGIPLVLAYQGWTYWVFRKRISLASIPV